MSEPTKIWLLELKGEFVTRSAMTPEDATQYVDGADWNDYYQEGFSPKDAAIEDMSYWDD